MTPRATDRTRRHPVPGAAVALVGILLLLAPPAVLAVLRWPALRSLAVLATTAVAAGAAVEVLQWVLPLGRVVPPVDAPLDAAGAIGGGLLAVAATVRRAGGLPRARRG